MPFKSFSFFVFVADDWFEASVRKIILSYLLITFLRKIEEKKKQADNSIYTCKLCAMKHYANRAEGILHSTTNLAQRRIAILPAAYDYRFVYFLCMFVYIV